jgi:uncharacterized delta-60 repeat protein
MAIVTIGLASVIVPSAGAAAAGPPAAGPARLLTGQLDPAFGTGGKVTTDFAHHWDSANALAVQPDRKLVVAGATGESSENFALVRYTVDGALDDTFGTGGKVATKVGDGGSANAVVALPDGRLVAAGIASHGDDTGFALARYHRDGTLDTSFGQAGTVITDVHTTDPVNAAKVTALAVQPDGKVVAAGSVMTASDQDFVLARYNRDGSPDKSFGKDGIVTTDLGTGGDTTAMVLDPQGRLTVASSAGGGGSIDFVLARYNRDGSLDKSFDRDGIVTTDFAGGADQATALTLQDGKLVAGGNTLDGQGGGTVLARYNGDGSLDRTFGTGGKVTTPGNDEVNTLLAQGSKLLAVGRKGDAFLLARYDRGGALDPTFGTGGRVITDFENSAWAKAAVFQSNGTVVAAGDMYADGTTDIAVARYRVTR